MSARDPIPVQPITPPEAVSGVQLMQGIGARPAQGFWADAWAHVSRRSGARFGMAWLGIVIFFAVFAPILASGHPLVVRDLRPEAKNPIYSPWLWSLSAVDVVLLLAGLFGVPAAIWAGARAQRGTRIKFLVIGVAVALGSTLPASLGNTLRSAPEPTALGLWLAKLADWQLCALGALVSIAIALALPIGVRRDRRLPVVLIACAIGAVGSWWGLQRPMEQFNYLNAERAGEIRATYTVVPFSPSQRFSELSRIPPMATLGETLDLPRDSRPYGRRFYMGTDAFGSDVLTQVLHACRLSISIGVVSSGIALLIGVTMGALMGYFGGWVDLFLYRIVEIFMAVPVLFLLIVAAAVLPNHLRTTYTLMAIIGCFTWMGAARFTRAEFLKLRNQDFVQSAKAVGLPLRSVLFKHMLPNGVAPVLVDTSFAIAAAISIEAVLSYLNLGPVDQASWGKLLASAMNAEGEFKWWLAVFPGVSIFLTVLSYNLVGEAFRDAIDPKLKKARV